MLPFSLITSNPYPRLRARRTTLSVGDDKIELMSLPDLVQAKKTQRDKDWPMVRRLIEVNYFANRENSSREQVRFWFLELRSPTYAFGVPVVCQLSETQLASAAVNNPASPILHRTHQNIRRETHNLLVRGSNPCGGLVN